MGHLRLTPFVVLAAIGILGFLGARGKAYENPRVLTCAFEMAELPMAAPDVLFVGSSRIGHGIAPGYMMTRLQENYGLDIEIERMAITRSQIPQFFPPLRRYLEERGAPEHVFLQLLYNFKTERHRTWDLPVNTLGSISMATLEDLNAARKNAVHNEYETVLPRRFEENYLSYPALLLQRLEMNVYSGLRYIPQQLRNQMSFCDGDQIHVQGHSSWKFDEIDDTTQFEDSSKARKKRKRNIRVTAKWLEFEFKSPIRKFENDQLHQLIALLEDAGSTVHLFLMPAIGDTSMSEQELADMAEIFPELDIVNPFVLFAEPFGEDLAKSFRDTHHPNKYGALEYSRFFTDAIAGLEF